MFKVERFDLRDQLIRQIFLKHKHSIVKEIPHFRNRLHNPIISYEFDSISYDKRSSKWTLSTPNILPKYPDYTAFPPAIPVSVVLKDIRLFPFNEYHLFNAFLSSFDALFQLHSLGIIHNDIHPSNIIIQKPLESDQIRSLIIDFETAFIGNQDIIKSVIDDLYSSMSEHTYLPSKQTVIDQCITPSRRSHLQGIYNTSSCFYGVPVFASRHAHMGVRDTYMKDVEALVFSYAHAMSPGCLPWDSEDVHLLPSKASSESSSTELFHDSIYRKKQELALLVLNDDDYSPKGWPLWLTAVWRRMLQGSPFVNHKSKYHLMYAYDFYNPLFEILANYHSVHWPLSVGAVTRAVDSMELGSICDSSPLITLPPRFSVWTSDHFKGTLERRIHGVPLDAPSLKRLNGVSKVRTNLNKKFGKFEKLLTISSYADESFLHAWGSFTGAVSAFIGSREEIQLLASTGVLNGTIQQITDVIEYLQPDKGSHPEPLIRVLVQLCKSQLRRDLDQVFIALSLHINGGTTTAAAAVSNKRYSRSREHTVSSTIRPGSRCKGKHEEPTTALEPVMTETERENMSARIIAGCFDPSLSLYTADPTRSPGVVCKIDPFPEVKCQIDGWARSPKPIPQQPSGLPTDWVYTQLDVEKRCSKRIAVTQVDQEFEACEVTTPLPTKIVKPLTGNHLLIETTSFEQRQMKKNILDHLDDSEQRIAIVLGPEGSHIRIGAFLGSKITKGQHRLFFPSLMTLRDRIVVVFHLITHKQLFYNTESLLFGQLSGTHVHRYPLQTQLAGMGSLSAVLTPEVFVAAVNLDSAEFTQVFKHIISTFLDTLKSSDSDSYEIRIGLVYPEQIYLPAGYSNPGAEFGYNSEHRNFPEYVFPEWERCFKERGMVDIAEYLRSYVYSELSDQDFLSGLIKLL